VGIKFHLGFVDTDQTIMVKFYLLLRMAETLFIETCWNVFFWRHANNHSLGNAIYRGVFYQECQHGLLERPTLIQYIVICLCFWQGANL